VSGLLVTAAALTAAVAGGRPQPMPIRLAAGSAASVLAARGVLGLVRPELLPAGGHAPFARLNRLYYSPLCLALAVAIGQSLTRRH
jgi:hypothetical protein